MKKLIFISVLTICLPLLAQSSKSVVGLWKYHHSTGSPCKDLISDLSYNFKSNGDYEVNAKMRRIGGISEETAKGTYTVNGTTITTLVEGHKIGPLGYRFENEFLVFEQQNPRCDIFLQLEDY